jgi:hypothetical protein
MVTRNEHHSQPLEDSIFLAGFTPKIVNISSYVLNATEISLLAKGKKFCPTPVYNDFLELKVNIADFVRKIQLKEKFGSSISEGGNKQNESLVKKVGTFIPETDVDSFINQTVLQMKNVGNILATLPLGDFHDNLKPAERAAMNRLSKNKQLTIRSADKGGGIVVMDTTLYQNKVEEHLSDQNTYEHLVNFKFSNRMSKIETFATKYEKKKFENHDNQFNILTRDESLYLRKFDCKIANFFGVPKIHKSKKINESMQKGYALDIKIPAVLVDLPFRYIQGDVAGPTCKLSELLDILLKPYLTLTPSYIRDSVDFLNKLPDVPPEEVEDTYMVTCDVINMYPNISLPLGLAAIKYWIEKHPDLLHKRFTLDFVVEGLSLVLKNSCFQFNDKYYRLKTGTATGTKVAPTYANLVMGYLETKLYSAVYNTFGYEIHGYIVKNWFRFLDDGFIFWKKSFGDVEVFVNLLNKLDSNLQFTHESSEEKISFLNISIFKKNNKFETDVFYIKKLITMTTYLSHHAIPATAKTISHSSLQG